MNKFLLEGRARPFARNHTAGYRARGGVEPAERPRRPPKFNSANQRMCDEPACVHPAARAKGDEQLCGAHFRIRYGYLGKLVEERDKRAAELEDLNAAGAFARHHLTAI